MRISEKPAIVRLTKALAVEFRDMEPCPHDRPISAHRLEVLKDIIKEGHFRICEWSSCFCSATGKTYRVNGKHTSHAFCDLYEGGNADKCQQLKIIITKYKVDTLEELAKLYSGFDSKVSCRSTGDINRVYAQCDPRLENLPAKVINLSVTAIAYCKWGASGVVSGKVLPDERAHEMLSHIDFVVWLHELLSTAPNVSDVKALLRSPTVSAMLVTYRKAPQKAMEFWVQVRDASSPNRLSPDRVLNKFLVQSSVNLGAGTMTRKNIVSVREMYDKSIHAWNAWRSGKQEIAPLKYFPSAKSPEVK